MRTHFLFILSLLSITARSQFFDSTYQSFSDRFQESALCYPFDTGSYIYSKPDLNAIPIFQFRSYDHPVRIIRCLEQTVRLDHCDNFWYEVMFYIDKKKYRGFIPGQSLALLRIPNNGSHILFNVRLPGEDAPSFLGHVKMVKGPLLLDAFIFDPVGGIRYTDNRTYNYYIGGKLIGSKGLKGVLSILEIAFGYDACGYNNGSNYIFLTPKGFKEEICEFGNGDADIYSYEINLTFPADSGGMKDRIIFKSELFEAQEHDSILTEHIYREYSWDGNHLKQLIEKKRSKTEKDTVDRSE